MLGRSSPILERLADLYEESTAGATGCVSRDFGIRFTELLELANCTKGESFALAVADLRRAQRAGGVQIDEHRRSHDWQRIRVPLVCEAILFAQVGRPSPTAEREQWTSLFEEASKWTVPETRRAGWLEFCRSRAEQARGGSGWKPFRRRHRHRAAMQLRILAKLLRWSRPSLIRTASAQLAGSSKFIERCVSTIETLLAESSGGAVKSLADLGIEYNPAIVRFHGPLRVRLHGTLVDYANHAGESALSEADLLQAEAIESEAPRCVTVENATKFHELCRLRCGDLFVFTSYPNQATVEFLRRAASMLPLFHFGDTDPWGFDVLRSLRQKLERSITPLHMHYRLKHGSPPLSTRDRRKLATLLTEPRLADVQAELERMNAEGSKGDFEQESLAITAARFPYICEA